jgi:molecular chaperone GrpE
MITPNSDGTQSTNDSVAAASENGESAVKPAENSTVQAQDHASEPVAEEEIALEGEIIELAPVDPLEELRVKLAESEGRLRAVSKGYTDLQQDMAGFRRRVDEQGRVKRDLKAFETVKVFFEPVQNLRRSLQSHGDEIPTAVIDGLRLVLSQFDSGLDGLGLAEVPGEGADFNPEYHSALALSPVPDASQDGKVIMVHTTGYTVNGKVLQASQVVVGQYTEEETPEA